MRILSVTTGIPSDAADWIRISAIAGMLKDRGHTVDMICYGKNQPDYSHEKLPLPPINYVVAPTIAAWVDHLRRSIRDRYDLVYANEDSAALISTSSRLPCIPFIFDMHGDTVAEHSLSHTDQPSSMRSRFQLMKTKLTSYIDTQLADRIICVSRSMIEHLHSKGIPVKRTAYVTNGIDLEFYKPRAVVPAHAAIRKRLGLEGKFIFGYLGNVQKWQGLDSLKEAAMIIKDQNTMVLIIGGRSEIREKNLVVCPWVYKAETRDYYSICDVLVQPRPSHAATKVAAPTKFAEYVGMGKPVLVTNVGDAADLTNEYKCGVVVDNNEPESLVEGMDRFRSMSASDLTKMGENSRKLAEQEFDWNKIAPRLWDAVETL